MIEIILCCLAASVIFYVVFGGADFGAGMIEFFCRRNKSIPIREIVTHAMGPVWEANHIWLILALVILFSAFPPAFAAISITLHIPLSLMLLGVVLRGTAFSFRHYDVYEESSDEMYSHVFEFASFLTALLQGIIAGALLLGRIGGAQADFYERFVAPWFNLFCISAGIFAAILYQLIAAVFLIGETKVRAEKEYFIHQTRILSLAVCLCSGLVIACGAADGYNLWPAFQNDYMLGMDALGACALLLVLIPAVNSKINLIPRAVVGSFVALIVLGWWRLQLMEYPNISAMRGMYANIYQVAAPAQTLRGLIIALAVGGALIFPSLLLLLKTFKSKGNEQKY